jgi:hypothetical protein
MLYWIVGSVSAMLIVFAVLTALTRRSNRRTPDDVADFIENFLDGKGDEWDWDGFITLPIHDPELDRIRMRCADLPDALPPGKGEVYCSEQGVAEMRGMVERLRAMQDEDDDFFDLEKAAFLKFDEPRDNHFAAIDEQVLALPVVEPSDPKVNILLSGSRRSKLDADGVTKAVRKFITDDFARFHREQTPDEAHMAIRYAVWRREFDTVGVCIATILYSSDQPGRIIYAQSEVERIADDVWLLYDNHSDAG